MINKVEWTEQSSSEMENSCVTIKRETLNLPKNIIECHFKGPKTGIGEIPDCCTMK